MKYLEYIRACFVCFITMVVLLPLNGAAQEKPNVPKVNSQPPSEGRDGQHDFDFNLGTWKTHIMRLEHPLTGSNSWVEMNGTVAVRKIWGGRAQLEEIEADGSSGHFEGLTVFLYNPKSHQWSQN